MRTPADLASRLRLALHRSGKTQVFLSIESGVPEATISRIATGDSANPKIDTLKKLAPVLGVSVGWLLGEPTAQITPHEAKTLLVAIEVARSRLRATYDTRTCPNAVPVGKLRGTRFFRPFEELNELPPTDITPDFIRAGAEVVLRSTDLSMLGAGIMHGELVYVRGERSLRALRGRVIVARLNDAYFIKRLTGPDTALILESEDDRYNSIEVRPDDSFFPFGLVVGRFADTRALALTWSARVRDE